MSTDSNLPVEADRVVAAGAWDSSRSASANLLVIALCLPAILYACLFTAMRPLGEVPLVLAVGSALLACLFSRRIWVSPRLLMFALLASVVLLLSLARVMPRAWTTLYDASAAVRQWSWIPILLVLLTAFRALLSVCGPFIEKNAILLLALVYVVTRASLLLGGETSFEQTFLIYTLTNENALVLILGTVAILRRPRSAVTLGILFAVMLLATSSAQTPIYVVCAALVAFSKRPHLVVATVLIGALALALISPLFMRSLYYFDPNTAIRSLFWRDVLVATWDTAGAGVGFGTESTVNDFIDIRDDDWQLKDDFAADRIFVATHSSFFDVLLKTGVPGIILFMLWFVPVTYPGKEGDIWRRRLAASLACLVIISSAVNSAFVSMNFLFGSSLALACIAYIRQSGRSTEAEPRRNRHDAGSTVL